MIKGLVYLTGLATLALVAAVGAVAYRVHTWPWGDYIREGREVVARKLAPANDGPGKDTADIERRVPADDTARRAVEHEASPEPRRPEPRTIERYTVRRGDTLYALARRHYGDANRWRSIARVNDIRKASDLKVGRLIVIPRSSTDAGRGGPDRDDGAQFVDLRLMLSPAVGPEGTPGEEVVP
ncbi:MAG: LysM peptidoglycan-binding domain-containing protein [Planctomycetota bacterium]|jgi:nucleoid-associated protein YgaU